MYYHKTSIHQWCPIAVAFFVGKHVTCGQGAVDFYILDFGILGQCHALAKEVVIDEGTVVFIIVTDKIQRVPGFYVYQIRNHLLCGEICAGTVFDDLCSGDIAFRMIVVKDQDQIYMLIIQESRNIAEDTVSVTLINRSQMIKCHRLTIDSDPGAVVFSDKVAILIKFKQWIQPKVYIAVTIIVKHIKLYGIYNSTFFTYS